jgi:lipopolysaccharide transport system permease protein
VFAGLCFWFLFSEATLQVAGSVAADAGVSQKVYFPRVLSPITALASRWIDLVVISLAIAALQLSFGIGTDSELAVYPAALLGLLLLAFGLGVLFAGLMIVHPDHRRILETILYLGLFLSPVLFSSAILPEAARPFAAVNPMTGILSALRGALFEPEQIDYFAWTIASLASLALALVGLWVLAVSARNHAEKL